MILGYEQMTLVLLILLSNQDTTAVQVQFSTVCLGKKSVKFCGYKIFYLHFLQNIFLTMKIHPIYFLY